ncbi:hypothetical protein HanIR_Chr10g0499131 [Helianthus annuus]|nr:hypothetical protein HanIR_Chr10g0499131 [Helianthus annuus]
MCQVPHFNLKKVLKNQECNKEKNVVAFNGSSLDFEDYVGDQMFENEWVSKNFS